MRPLRPCGYPGCGELVVSGRCEKHTKQEQRCDKRRGSSTERGYNARWQRYRTQFLMAHPLCECKECKDGGLITVATVVDHIIPHKGNYNLFWDPSNHQAMSKQHHDRKTATEDGGFGNGRF
ncbi:MAG: HNH endonuclease signature motif containing protein [Desulfosporosinus sp.]